MEWQELERWTFGGDNVDTDALVRLVLAGEKRATTSCLAAYRTEGEPLPQSGERSVLTWEDETPAAVLRLTRVTVLPFAQVPWELAAREGENQSLEEWRAVHRSVFTEEGRELGYRFTPEAEVVIEEFEVEEVL